MGRWKNISDDVMGAMPTTELKGFICDVDVDPMGEMTEEAREAAEERFFREIDKMLPEYATYVPESSSIRLPIDQADGFEVDWEYILAEAYRRISE